MLNATHIGILAAEILVGRNRLRVAKLLLSIAGIRHVVYLSTPAPRHTTTNIKPVFSSEQEVLNLQNRYCVTFLW
jgi:hypothetical protein